MNAVAAKIQKYHGPMDFRYILIVADLTLPSAFVSILPSTSLLSVAVLSSPPFAFLFGPDSLEASSSRLEGTREGAFGVPVEGGRGFRRSSPNAPFAATSSGFPC